MNLETAIFAGGCFWCLQADFDHLAGVIETIAGYDGGEIQNPTYQQVCSGSTGYAECVKVIYDAEKISYSELLAYFWRHIDPTLKDAQFCDVGKQYRTAIFYLTLQQKSLALASLKEIQQRFEKVYTEIVASTHFYRAENSHQKYYQQCPISYYTYRIHSGRDKILQTLWKPEKVNDRA